MKKEAKLKLIILLLTILLVISTIFIFNFYNRYKQLRWPCQPLTCMNENISVITLFDDNYYNYSINLINNAKKEIYVAMFEFKLYDNNKVRKVTEALVNAKQRGVDVKVLLDKSDWNKKIEKENKKTINYLKQYDIDAKLDTAKQTLHAKFIVVDDTVIIGSTNLVYYALYKNAETNIAIKNRKIAQDFIDYFNFLWKKAD